MRIFTVITFINSLVFLHCIGVISDQREKADKSVSTKTLALIAMGQGGSEYGTPQGGGEVGVSGQELTSADGNFKVFIPEGAMQEGDSQYFEITRYNAATNALPNGFLPSSHIYEVQPSYVFRKNVRVTIRLETDTISANNLDKNSSRGFSWSSKSPYSDAGRLQGWGAFTTKTDGDSISFETRTFSLFGAGSPPPGNRPPTILGAYYYFKTGCSFVPYRVRAQVIEPDGDTLDVRLLTGPPGKQANVLPMEREGSTDWYSADIFKESVTSSGTDLQIVATDNFGSVTNRPSTGLFHYPTDSGDPNYISQYNIDNDGDGILCLWEADQGLNDSDPNDTSSYTDSDGDGIPDVSDDTPSGQENPVVDSLVIFPAQASANIGEQLEFGLMASMNGQPRFVRTNLSTTGNALSGAPVGALTNSSFLANAPGIAGIHAIVTGLSATATVTVRDSLQPSDIVDLSAQSYSFSTVRLEWTAPGDDGQYGRVTGYQIRVAGTPISNTDECTSGWALNHSVTPEPAGIVQSITLNGFSPDTSYYFCILAFDSNGNFNSWSQSPVSVHTQGVPDVTAPSNVTDGVATATGPNSIQLTWTTVGDDEMTGAAAAYEIRRSATPITNDLQCDTALIVPNTAHSLAAGTIVNFEVRGLDDGRPYYFCIRAFDESNNRSSWNGTLTATTPQANEAPIADAGLDTNATLGESVQLSAALSSDPDATACGASSGQYVYQWTLTNAPASSQLSSADIVNSDQMDAYFVPDVAGTYVVQLSLTDDAGSCTGGDRTDVDSTHILVSAAVPPTNLSVQLLKNGLEVTWDAAAGISEYELFYSTTSPVVLSDPSFSSSGTLFLITQILEGGKTYYFALASRYDGGLSELGDEVSFFLPDQICGNATISFPEQCDDGNTNNGDGCSTNCEVEFAFQCTNGDPSVCTAPNDLGTFGVGDTIQPLSGPPLAAGETANYFVSVVEAVSISATLQATTGDPDLAFFKCDGTGIANFSSPGDETMSDYFFGPSCYVVRITAVSDLPNGFLLTQTINAP